MSDCKLSRQRSPEVVRPRLESRVGPSSAMVAAARLKKRSIKQRLGIRARLSLPAGRAGWGSQDSLDSLGAGNYDGPGYSNWQAARGGPGYSNWRAARGGRRAGPGRGGGRWFGLGRQGWGQGFARRRAGRGRRKGRRGGGRKNPPPPTREELDKELDCYMAETKGVLDKEMDAYMEEGQLNKSI